MENKKIDEVLTMFFDSLKNGDDQVLESGMTTDQTVDMVHQTTSMLISKDPAKFELYTKWFLEASMYLLEDINELENLKEIIQG